jgi:hypothetical protein
VLALSTRQVGDGQQTKFSMALECLHVLSVITGQGNVHLKKSIENSFKKCHNQENVDPIQSADGNGDSAYPPELGV